MAQMIVTVELSAEDRARIDKLLEKLDRLTTHDCSKCVDNAVQYVAAMQSQADATPTADQEPTADTPAPEKPVEAVQEHTVAMEDVQKKVVELSAAGKKADVRAIVKDYAERVSGIPADKLPEVWSRLAALEG